MASARWTKSQLQLAFYLYCQLPFGKLHQHNPEVIRLANEIGRTPSAVAMKLVNFASLDPAIRASGRKGLQGASSADLEIWQEFHENWEGLALECARLRKEFVDPAVVDADLGSDAAVPDEFTGETRRTWAELRVKQHFFRRAVLSSYGMTCCMSGATEPQLLVASHIVPWSEDKANRLNPCNGLCLSAIHDRAFDRGLITVTEDYTVVVSETLLSRSGAFVQGVFAPLAGKRITLPQRFSPDRQFLAWHRAHRFPGKPRVDASETRAR
jgi:hypothetical protein